MHNQPCLTFDDLMRSYLEIEGNFTLMFLKGYHMPTRQLSLHEHTIYYSNWTMVGKSTEAIIYGTDLRFEFAGKLHIVNLTLTKGSFKLFEPTQARLSSVTLVDFALDIRYADLVHINNCKFLSGASR